MAPPKSTPADLDEAGAYGNWPEDFDDVDLDDTESLYKGISIASS